MANDTEGRVKYFDSTTGATVSGVTRVLAIYWVEDETAAKDIAADDDFLVVDSNSKRIIGKRAAAAGDELYFGPFCSGIPVDGLTISAMDGGVCYVVTE